MRRRLVLLTLLALPLTAMPAAPPARAEPPPTWSTGQVIEVGGVELTAMPTLASEPQWFDSEGDDGKRISTVVWESLNLLGYQVDASVTVIRAPHLRSPVRAYVWFKRWQERPEGEATYRRLRLPTGQPAWLARDQIIWQPARGLVASVTLRSGLASAETLIGTTSVGRVTDEEVAH